MVEDIVCGGGCSDYFFSWRITVYLELGRCNAFKAVRQKAFSLGLVKAAQLFQGEKIEVSTATKDNELLLTWLRANQG